VCTSCQTISSVHEIDEGERVILDGWPDAVDDVQVRFLDNEINATDGPGEPRGLEPQEIREWAQESLEIQLDDDQEAAVASDEPNVLVVARAGSGKTRVLTTKALWLQQGCQVDPSQILLLAFNVKAKEEVSERIRPHVGAEMPHVLTFHALANAVVQPLETYIHDDLDAQQRGLTREIAALERNTTTGTRLTDRIKSLARSESRGDKFLRFVLSYFNLFDYWPRIVNGEIDLVANDADSIRSHEAAQRQTTNVVLADDKHSLNGDLVKSYGELAISDALFLNDIEAEYEQAIHWDGTTYRPDFTISTGDDTGVVIEYFGLLTNPLYRRQAERKRRYWRDRQGWELIEITPTDLVTRDEEEFTAYLLRTLRDLGIESRPLSPDEVLERLPLEIDADTYTRPLTSFVSRCRNLGWSHEDLTSSIRHHQMADIEERDFLSLAEEVYKAYLDEVIGDGYEDFSGLLWRAAAKIENGETEFKYQGNEMKGDLRQIRHVLIDEFQDFSEPFHAILRALRGANPNANVFAVGDDWQAINGFAGSDLKFFKNFGRYFSNPEELHLSRNYRSTRSIVEVSNALMASPAFGEPTGVAVTSKEGQARLWNPSELVLLPSEEVLPDKPTVGILRLIGDHLNNDRRVVLLSRTNTFPQGTSINEFLLEVHKRLPEQKRGQVSISTTHRFKGLEETAVIVLDARERRYPLLHPDQKYQRLFGDTEQALQDAERRLFYVALTRAVESLDLITAEEPEQRSPFLDEIDHILVVGDWETLPPLDSFGPESIQIRVSNGYEVREDLGSSGYRFHPETRTWRKSMRTEDLDDFEGVREEPWFIAPVAVEIIDATGAVIWSARAQ